MSYSRHIRKFNFNDLEGKTIYFLRKIYSDKSGGGETLMGPYLRKPGIPKNIEKLSYAAKIEEYILTKKEEIENI